MHLMLASLVGRPVLYKIHFAHMKDCLVSVNIAHRVNAAKSTSHATSPLKTMNTTSASSPTLKSRSPVATRLRSVHFCSAVAALSIVAAPPAAHVPVCIVRKSRSVRVVPAADSRPCAAATARKCSSHLHSDATGVNLFAGAVR